MPNSSIWSIDRTLSVATSMGQSGPGSDGNKGVLHISQSSSITGASLSDCLVSYPRHSMGAEVVPSPQRCSWCILQSWVMFFKFFFTLFKIVGFYLLLSMIYFLRQFYCILIQAIWSDDFYNWFLWVQADLWIGLVDFNGKSNHLGLFYA